jgi:hypothetical protein
MILLADNCQPVITSANHFQVEFLKLEVSAKEKLHLSSGFRCRLIADRCDILIILDLMVCEYELNKGDHMC